MQPMRSPNAPLTPLTYSAAKAAAERIHVRLNGQGKEAGVLPDPATLAAVIDAAFWTSLRREEIYTPRISFAFTAADQVKHPIMFTTPLALGPSHLIKLASAVERPGIHLCVWPSPGFSPELPGELRVWGIASHIPASCVVVEIILPGLLVVKQSPVSDGGKFRNIAVLQGDEVKIIEAQLPLYSQTIGPDRPEVLSALMRMESQFAIGPSVNLLLQLAVSMRAHGHGGMLLVVPNASEAWKTSILHPVTYEVTPAYSRLAKLMRKGESPGPWSGNWEDALARAVDGIAGLTAVDGATVINANYELLAFGAKIVRRKLSPQVASVMVTEPVEGSVPVLAEPVDLGGTRHLAAAQFVHDQHDAIALVASQDGRFTVFGWSPGDEMVHARRMDALLL